MDAASNAAAGCWPEDMAVCAWAKENCPNLPYSALQPLSKAVTAFRVEIQRESDALRARVAALEAELRENVADAKTLADFYSGCCLFAYIGRLATPAPPAPAFHMEELPPEFADVLEKHKWDLYAKSDERPATQVPDGICIDDGGTCGIGGYCERCPLSAAQAKEGTQ